MSKKIQVKAMFYGDFQKRVINNLINERTATIDGTLLLTTEQRNTFLTNTGMKSTFPEKVSVPSTAVSSGTAGQIAISSTHLYVCVATDSWKRVALSAW